MITLRAFELVAGAATVATAFAVAAVAAGCGGRGAERARGGEPAATITVTRELRQPIDGWGASVVSDDPEEPLLRPALPEPQVRRLDRLVFRDAGINLIRIFSPGYADERARGRVGPPVASDVRFAFMRRVRPYGVRFMLTGADAPASMLAVPLRSTRVTRGKALAVGKEKAYAVYLTRILRFAKERVGVPFDYVAAANEPNNSSVLLTMTPSQAARVYVELERIIKAEQLGTKLVVGDDSTWHATFDYARVELAVPSVRENAAAVASHDYLGTGADRRAVAQLARRKDLAVWQTEWTNGCGECSDRGPQAMRRALGWSERIADALVQANARAWFAFIAVAERHGATGALIVLRRGNRAEPFYLSKRFFVFQQYSRAAPPGSRRLALRIEPESQTANILAVAFRSGRTVSVVVTNGYRTRQPVLLDVGAGDTVLRRHRTSASENFRALPPLSYPGGPLRVTLAPESVTTFTRS